MRASIAQTQLAPGLALLFEPVAHCAERLATPGLVGVPPIAEARSSNADEDRAADLPDLEVRPGSDTTTSIYVLRGHQYFTAMPDRGGITHAPLFALDFQTIDGPKLRITAADGSVEI
jgi:hypothetical protein